MVNCRGAAQRLRVSIWLRFLSLDRWSLKLPVAFKERVLVRASLG